MPQREPFEPGTMKHRPIYEVHIYKCLDCPMSFSTVSPLAKRCPKCRIKHKKEYMKHYKGKG